MEVQFGSTSLVAILGAAGSLIAGWMAWRQSLARMLGDRLGKVEERLAVVEHELEAERSFSRQALSFIERLLWRLEEHGVSTPQVPDMLRPHLSVWAQTVELHVHPEDGEGGGDA